MKFTPSSKFLSIAKSSYKVISKKIYARKTSTLTTALNTGTWVDVTRFVDVIPDVTTQIEADLGVFTADAMPLVAKNVEWLFANVFNASATEYIEIKVEFLIGFSASDMATETIYYFSGYVDKNTIVPGEVSNTVQFTVDSVDALMNKIYATSITTQYYEPVQAAIACINIPGLYVSDCNISSYVLSPGVHTVSYDFNNGYMQARLNDGMWVALAGGGSFTLGDGETTALDRQRITVKVVVAELQRDNTPREEKIIITTSGTTLPRTWITGISMRAMAKKMYDSIGLTTQTFDTLQMNTFDGTTKNVSILQHVNDGQSTSDMGYSYAMAYKNTTTIFVASGIRVYAFNPTTGASTYLFSVTAGYVISKLMYNSRNDHLWVLFGNNIVNSYGDSLARYDVAGASLSSTITVTNARNFSIELYDIANSSGGTYEYSLLYPETNNRRIKRVDGSSMAVTTLFENTDLGYSGSDGPLIGYAYQLLSSGESALRFFAIVSSAYKIHEIAYDTHTPAWYDNSQINTAPPFLHNIGGYIPGEDRVYAFDGATNDIRKYDATGSSATDVITLDDNDVCEGIFGDGTYVILTTKLRRYFHYINNSAVNTIDVNMYCAYAGFTTGNSRTYGVDIFGRVFQFHTVIERFLDQCFFEGKTTKAAFTNALRATNCIATTSFAKSAMIYQRGDASGDPVTSGNQITVTVSNIADIQKNDRYGKAYAVVALDNGKSTINYDGTNYNVLVSDLDDRVLTIQNTLIPNNVIKDYCKNFYEYFKTARTLYTVPVLQTMFHIEPIDGATLDLTTTKITSSASNKPIYSASYSSNGKMKIGVLV